MAAAFAGIPSLTVIGALVRAPGDLGFNEDLLIAGVALAALGALVGILAFAQVLAPARLVDTSISDGVMNNLPEARFASYAALREGLEETRDDVGAKRVLASDESGRATAAEALAVQAEAAAKLANELVGDEKPPPADKVAEAARAQANARTLRADAGVAAATAALSAKDLELTEQILDSLETLRRGAYGLQAGETVQQRFTNANYWSVLAVAAVAAGVICLALAPNSKDPEPAPASSLVTLTLTADGQEALGCHATTVDALEVGGEDDAPTVIVLPGGGCPVRAIKFTTADPTPLGTVKGATIVDAG